MADVPRTDGEATPSVDAALALVDRAEREVRGLRTDLLSAQSAIELLLDIASPLALVQDGTVRGWSHALEELTGVRADAVIGTAGPALLRDGCTDRSGRRWAPSRRGGGHDFEVVVLTLADDDTRP